MTTMSTIASRVAGRIIAMEQKTALDLANLIQSVISSSSGINWGWDIRTTEELPSFGFHEKKFSFPGRPGIFDAEGLLGGIHVEGKLSGDPAPNTSVTANLTGAYYNKNKHGGGDLSRHQNMGTFEIEFDQNGMPSFTKGQDTTKINSTLQSIINGVVSSPPDNAKSTSKIVLKRLDKQKQLNEMNTREEEKRRGIQDENIDTYGTIEHFVEHIKSENDGVFGPRDLNRLSEILNLTQKIKPNKKTLQEELRKVDLVYNPDKMTVSSKPSDIANDIRLVALRIDSSTRPSRSKIAAEIRGIIASIKGPQTSPEDEFSDDEEYIREQQENEMMGDYDDRNQSDDPPVRPY